MNARRVLWIVLLLATGGCSESKSEAYGLCKMKQIEHGIGNDKYGEYIDACMASNGYKPVFSCMVALFPSRPEGCYTNSWQFWVD